MEWGKTTGGKKETRIKRGIRGYKRNSKNGICECSGEFLKSFLSENDTNFFGFFEGVVP